MAALRRRALRATLTLAVALAAGLAANCWAASDTPGAAEGAAVLPVAAPATAPKVVGHESRQGQAIMLGSRITSGPGSGVKFTLQDHSVVIIGPNSTLSVDEFAADRIVLRLERGSFYVDSANPGVVHIVLPSGTVAVRAATVGGRIGPDATEIALLSVGRAEVAGFGGRSVQLDSIGQATRIVGLGSPSAPVVLSPQRLQDFSGLTGQVASLD